MMSNPTERRPIWGWCVLFLMLCGSIRGWAPEPMEQPLVRLNGVFQQVDPLLLGVALQTGDDVLVTDNATVVKVGAFPMLTGAPLDPNSASAVAIAQLPHVSDAVAEQWVASRQRFPFRRAPDLARLLHFNGWHATQVAPWLAPEPWAPRLDPNLAAPEQLEMVPGIGQVMASRIIQGRPYQSTDGLLRVRGIGPKTLLRFREHLDVP